ncbi:MAG: TIR domain-containing protein [Lachnospiraceae bacterium]|nr:TIR domain-containing protein [Lachnospiraceae bacterium]
MTDQKSLDVFVSYSSKNKNVADAIVADFEQHGIRCWYAPRDIMPGDSWVSAITEALQVVKVQVLIYTDESNTSRQVMNEVAVAFNAGKTIVPFRLTQTKMSNEFEYYLSCVHWLDALTESLSDNITQLRKYVEVILSGVNNVYSKEPTEPTVEKKNSKKGLIISGCAAVLVLALGLLIFALIKSNNTETTDPTPSDTTTTAGDLSVAGNPSDMPDNTPSDTTLGTSGAGDGSSVTDSTPETGIITDSTEGTSETESITDSTEDTSETENITDSTEDTSETESITDLTEDTSETNTTDAVTGSTDGSQSGSKSTADKKDVSAMSVEELETSARKGVVEACDELGARYYEGDGVDRDYDKALLYLSKAVENNTTSVKTYRRLGNIYYYGRGVDESDSDARKYYKKAIDLGSEDSEVWSNYGMILYRDESFKESAESFAHAAQIDNDPMTMYNAGLAYYSLEDYDQALMWMNKALDNGYERPQDIKAKIRSMTSESSIP